MKLCIALVSTIALHLGCTSADGAPAEANSSMSDAALAEPDPGRVAADAASTGPPITFVGDAATPEVKERLTALIAREVTANAAIRSWFDGKGIRVRVLGAGESMTKVPEFVERADRFGAPPEAFGLTLPARIDRDFFCAVKASRWLEQTTIHEVLHVIGFAAAEVSGVDLRRKMDRAFAKSTLTIEGSDANAQENFAYKGQHYLSGNGDVLRRANDPTFELFVDLYPEPLFVEQKDRSDALLDAAGVE